MSNSVSSREIALDVLIEILEKDGYSHIILRQALNKYQYLPKQDRAFITRLVEGTLEYLLQIDYVINSYSKTPVHKMKPVIRSILRMSVYQILHMDRIPDSAACNEAVKLAVKRKFQGLKGFVNGVLRTVSREKDSLVFPDLSIRCSIPTWMTGRWEKAYGLETAEKIAEAFLEERGTFVRCNLDKASKEEILKSLEAQNIQAKESGYSDSVLLISGYDYLESVEAFARGWLQVQDLSSSFVGDAAAPREGDYVIDVCGAPGGKSLHIADKLKGTGMVEVRDLTWQKVQLIEENIDRTGFSNLRTKQWDALVTDEENVGKADIVIADLPCSGLGIIGKKPDIKYRMTEEKMEALSQLQREILSVVWQYVKPGGTLVYSTCTINQEENEENARWFLENFPFETINIEGRLGSQIQEESMKQGMLQLLPGIYPCDGFFIAVFRRQPV